MPTVTRLTVIARFSQLLLCLLLFLSAPLQAQLQEVRYYQIAAQELTEALRSFARRSGLQLAYSSEAMSGLSSNLVEGELDAATALTQLLQNTGIQFSVSGDNTLLLTPISQAAAGEAQPQLYVLPSVQVESEAISDEVFQGAATVNLISREQMDRFTATNVGDIFRDIPGVTATNNRTGASLDLNIRGIQGMGRVKILVDGTNAASSDYRGYGGFGSHVFVDPELIGGVTIEKGPSSGPYGAGATAGVVNLRTLDANDLISEGKDYGLRLRGALGNNSHDGSLDGNDGAGNSIPGNNYVFSAAGAWRVTDYLDLTLGLSKRQSGNYSVGSRGITDDGIENRTNPAGSFSDWYVPTDIPKGSVVDNTSQDVFSVLLKASIQLSNSQSLELGFTTYDNLYGNPRLTATGAPEQHRLSETDKETYTAKYNWAPANPLIDLRANVWTVRAEEYRAGGLVGDTHEQIATTRSRGIEVWNTSRFSWDWLPRQDWRYGGSWLHEKLDMTELGSGGNFPNPEGERDIWSAFTEVEALPFDWLQLHGGLRYDSYNLTGEKSFTSQIPGQAPTLARFDDGRSRVNPNLGVVLMPWGEQARFFARYSEGWRPGSVREVINSYWSLSQEPNLLRPEVSKNLEIGTRFDTSQLFLLDDRVSLGLTWFNTRYEDFVTGSFGYFSNIEGTRYRGLEFSLDYDTGLLFVRYDLTRYLKQQVCYGGTDWGCASRVYRGNTALDFGAPDSPPRYRHNLTLGTRWLNRKLETGLRITDVSDRMMPQVDINNSRETFPAWETGWVAYRVYDFYGSYKVNANLSFNLSVENLRDEYYLEVGASPQLTIPAPGRTVKFAFTYKL